MVGDDPQLTVRLPEGEELEPPVRVVLDDHGRLSAACTAADRDGAAPTIAIHGEDVVPDSDETPAFAVDGEHTTIYLKGPVDLDDVLAQLRAERGIGELQVEAGAILGGAFLRAGLVDELLLYIAPILLGERGRPLFAGLHIDAMTERLRHAHRRDPPHRRGRARAAAAGSGGGVTTPRRPSHDHFSAVAAAVRQRATGISRMRCSTWIASIVPAHARAWEAGLRQRPGQPRSGGACSTACIATDPSAAQIAQAHGAGATSRFAVEPGERCSLADASVDAVCVAQALHWFDRAAFFAQCTRVLKPGGVLVAWGYQDIEVPRTLAAADAALQDGVRDVLATGTDADRQRLRRFRLAVPRAWERRPSNCVRNGRCRACSAISPAIRPASATGKRPGAIPSRCMRPH